MNQSPGDPPGSCLAGDGQMPLVGPSHPVDQPVRRLGWRGTVERHHGRWNAGAPPQLGAPPVAGVGDFDLEGTLADELFKAMNGHVCRRFLRTGRAEDPTRVAGMIKRSASRRRRPHAAGRQIHATIPPQIFLRCQLLHRFCTTGPQVFHTRGLLPVRGGRFSPPMHLYSQRRKGPRVQ